MWRRNGGQDKCLVTCLMLFMQNSALPHSAGTCFVMLNFIGLAFSFLRSARCLTVSLKRVPKAFFTAELIIRYGAFRTIES